MGRIEVAEVGGQKFGFHSTLKDVYIGKRFSYFEIL